LKKVRRGKSNKGGLSWKRTGWQWLLVISVGRGRERKEREEEGRKDFILLSFISAQKLRTDPPTGEKEEKVNGVPYNLLSYILEKKRRKGGKAYAEPAPSLPRRKVNDLREEKTLLYIYRLEGKKGEPAVSLLPSNWIRRNKVKRPAGPSSELMGKEKGEVGPHPLPTAKTKNLTKEKATVRGILG